MSRSANDIGLLYAALNSEVGIEVDCAGKPEVVRQRFYKLKRDNPDFTHLAFLISPDDPTKLWIMRTDHAPSEAERNETHD